MSKKIDNNVISPHAFSRYDNLVADLDILAKYIEIFAKIAGRTIVIKCGNGVLNNEEAMISMARDIAVLQSSGVRVVVVHGGGDKISTMLKKCGAVEEFIDGERVIKESDFGIVEMVLKGNIAPAIVSDINNVGGIAISISGRDNNFIKADKMRRIKKDPGSAIERIVELGLVGEPISVNLDFIETMFDSGNVPVVTPIGTNDAGRAYVINADILAGFIAEHMQADLLVFLSDFDGIKDASGTLLNKISSDKLKVLIESDVIHPELKIKAQTALNAVKNNVGACSIINGHDPHVILLDLLKENGIGTTVFQNSVNMYKPIFPLT